MNLFLTSLIPIFYANGSRRVLVLRLHLLHRHFELLALRSHSEKPDHWHSCEEGHGKLTCAGTGVDIDAAHSQVVVVVEENVVCWRVVCIYVEKIFVSISRCVDFLEVVGVTRSMLQGLECYSYDGTFPVAT